jgi:L-lysine exporter family protein LysE/ArgO
MLQFSDHGLDGYRKRNFKMASTIAGSLFTLIQGFLLCTSIIIAIGPQNLFILRQGLRRQYLFAIALFSALADVILISLAVSGLSALISTNGVIQTIVTGGGIVFLLVCGIRSMIRAYRPRLATEQPIPNTAVSGLQTVILATLSFSFLNPSAYLDTLVLIGSKSLLFSGDQRVIFGIGAMLASTCWFFTLAYGAGKFSPIFRSQAAWRTLDIISGCIMLVIAVTMIAPHQLSL